MHSDVKMISMQINDFMNVKNGSIHMKDHILGIFGQNGSGKSVVIHVFNILKYALISKPIADVYSSCIALKADQTTLSFKLMVGEHHVTYTFSLRAMNQEGEMKRLTISHERLTYDKVVIDTDTEEPFILQDKPFSFDDPQKRIDQLVAKGLCHKRGQADLFSSKLRSALKKSEIVCILKRLEDYGRNELIVDDPIMQNDDTLQLFGKNNFHVSFALDGVTSIPENFLMDAQAAIDKLNIVLPNLIPHLTLGLQVIGSHLNRKSEVVAECELVSHKNEEDIPLSKESVGIKKLLSITSLFLQSFHHPSSMIVIDDLDTCIFEYLLGEVLRIMMRQGKGQFLFTAHNLRVLEVLDQSQVIFTTTNNENRYVYLTHVRKNENLRQYYIRNILIDEQKETLYDYIPNFDIAIAFLEAQ